MILSHDLEIKQAFRSKMKTQTSFTVCTCTTRSDPNIFSGRKRQLGPPLSLVLKISAVCWHYFGTCKLKYGRAPLVFYYPPLLRSRFPTGCTTASSIRIKLIFISYGPVVTIFLLAYFYSTQAVETSRDNDMVFGDLPRYHIPISTFIPTSSWVQLNTLYSQEK